MRLEQQANMGEDWANDQQLTMTLDGDKGKLAPRGDENSLKAAALRMKLMGMGQQPMIQIWEDGELVREVKS